PTNTPVSESVTGALKPAANSSTSCDSIVRYFQSSCPECRSRRRRKPLSSATYTKPPEIAAVDVTPSCGSSWQSNSSFSGSVVPAIPRRSVPLRKFGHAAKGAVAVDEDSAGDADGLLATTTASVIAGATGATGSVGCSAGRATGRASTAPVVLP